MDRQNGLSRLLLWILARHPNRLPSSNTPRRHLRRRLRRRTFEIEPPFRRFRCTREGRFLYQFQAHRPAQASLDLPRHNKIIVLALVWAIFATIGSHQPDVSLV